MVIFFTLHMGDEYKNWGFIVLIAYVFDIAFWEFSSLIGQIVVIKKLQRSEASARGKSGFWKMLVTPPLYFRAIN